MTLKLIVFNNNYRIFFSFVFFLFICVLVFLVFLLICAVLTLSLIIDRSHCLLKKLQLKQVHSVHSYCRLIYTLVRFFEKNSLWFFLILLVFVVLIAVLSFNIIDKKYKRWSLRTQLVDVLM